MRGARGPRRFTPPSVPHLRAGDDQLHRLQDLVGGHRRSVVVEGSRKKGRKGGRGGVARACVCVCCGRGEAEQESVSASAGVTPPFPLSLCVSRRSDTPVPHPAVVDGQHAHLSARPGLTQDAFFLRLRATTCKPSRRGRERPQVAEPELHVHTHTRRARTRTHAPRPPGSRAAGRHARSGGCCKPREGASHANPPSPPGGACSCGRGRGRSGGGGG